MSADTTDRLFRMSFNGVDRAGSELLEHLAASAQLPKDFDLHLQALPPEAREASFTQAIRVAIGAESGEMPAWAAADHELPDVLEIGFDVYMREQFARINDLDKQYYSMLSLVRTLRGNSENNYWRKRASTIAHMSWRRILEQIDPLSKQRFQYIDSFRSQTEADSSNIHLAYVRSRSAEVMCISDNILYDMMQNNLIGLRSTMKGTGEVAVLGIATMLFNEGCHLDMQPYAEKLEEYVEAHGYAQVV